VIRRVPKLALGTDSALTAEGDMIDEIRLAMREGGLGTREIYPMVTTVAAEVLRLNGCAGRIREGGNADLVAVKDTGQTPSEALRILACELVLVAGEIMLISRSLSRRSGWDDLAGEMHRIEMEDRGEWLIRTDVPQLYTAAAAVLGDPVRLAGRRVLP
jgi:adenine deaminase